MLKVAMPIFTQKYDLSYFWGRSIYFFLLLFVLSPDASSQAPLSSNWPAPYEELVSGGALARRPGHRSHLAKSAREGQANRAPGRRGERRHRRGAALHPKAAREDASLYQANLPFGSGATESTCWQMQRRVQRPGQSWEVPGLRGILAIRGLVLTERWSEAWKPYAAKHLKVVHCVN